MEIVIPMLITFIIGVLFGFALSYFLQKEIKDMSSECPHGYRDWDLCPDCCH